MTAGRQLAALRADRATGGHDAVRHATALVAEEGGALVLMGLALRERSLDLWRVAALAMRNASDETDWAAWALLLMPPYSSDPTTNLNILTGIVGAGAWNRVPANAALARLMVGFLQHAMTQPALVSERTIEALAEMPGQALSAFGSDQFEALARSAEPVVAAIADSDIREALDDCLATARARHRTSDALSTRASTLLQVQLRVEARGAEARKLAQHAATFVDAWLASTTAQPKLAVLQRVRLAGSSLDDDRVWAATRAWSAHYKRALQRADLRVQLRPAGAQLGSFVIDQLVRGDEPTETILRASELDQDSEDWRELLEVLSANGLTIEVHHFWGTARVTPICWTREAIRQHREALGPVPASRVDSVLVPQADRIEKVFRVVDLVTHGEAVLPETLGVVPRQVAYYKRAAKILRLLNEDDTLSAAGRHLAHLAEDQRLQTAVVLFESCDVGEAWIAWSNGRTLLDVDPDTAESFVEERTHGLSGKTLKRRAQTLQAWWTSLTPHHYSAG